MDVMKLNEVCRLPKEEGYIGGYRIHTRLSKSLTAMSQATGLSKMHCLEIVLAEYFADDKPSY
jgi:hypothetical protein